MMAYADMRKLLESEGYTLKEAKLCTLVYIDGHLEGTLSSAEVSGDALRKIVAEADLLTMGEQNAQQQNIQI